MANVDLEPYHTIPEAGNQTHGYFILLVRPRINADEQVSEPAALRVKMEVAHTTHAGSIAPQDHASHADACLIAGLTGEDASRGAYVRKRGRKIIGSTRDWWAGGGIARGSRQVEVFAGIARRCDVSRRRARVGGLIKKG